MYKKNTTNRWSPNNENSIDIPCELLCSIASYRSINSCFEHAVDSIYNIYILSKGAYSTIRIVCMRPFVFEHNGPLPLFPVAASSPVMWQIRTKYKDKDGICTRRESLETDFSQADHRGRNIVMIERCCVAVDIQHKFTAYSYTI